MPSFDKKYRAKDFDEFIGNELAIRRIKSRLGDISTFPSTTLLYGPPGCGKTTLARIIAKKLGIKDIINLNVSDSRKLDDARSIIENVRYSSMHDEGGKVIILEECHRAIKEFWDALLTTLEEPPKGVYFILCTTDPQMLLSTVISRSNKIRVSTLSSIQMKKLIKTIAKKEKIRLKPSVIRTIITTAEGTPRNTMDILNSVKDIKSPSEMIDCIKSMDMSADSENVKELCQAMLKNLPYNKTMAIADKIDGDPERIRRGIIGYMSKILIKEDNPKAALIINNFWDSIWMVGKPGLISCVYETIVKKED